MVSFSCEACGDVLTKKKLDGHKQQCRGSSFTCLDCMVHFMGSDYRSHTSCISEAQKYQGALYKPEKEKRGKANGSKVVVPHKAYVEDAEDDYTGAITIVEAPPEAPSPPSAAPGFRTSPTEPVNVFDFYEGASTPNQSTLNLAALERQRMIENTPVERNGDRSVWFQDEVIEEEIEINGALVQYGSGPVPTGAFRTPAPKDERERRKIRGREPTTQEKKDKKRKRLHVDTSSAERSRSREADEVMTDAPPVLHSGLTGGLNRLLAPGAFPPSPEFSGDRDEASPASPLKKPKHSKRGRERQRDTISNGIMSALMGTRKSKKATEGDRVRKHKRRLREGSERPEGQKMIEYKPLNGESGNGENQQMVVYGTSTRAQLFMSLINKGPESEKGCSMNKTLKRYHRERAAVGMSKAKSHEEKELWRCLRLKKNDRGEIVLFCEET